MPYLFGFLMSVLGGFIVTGAIYLAGSQNEGEAIFWGLIVTVILTIAAAGYLWMQRKRQPPPTIPPTLSPRIKARESDDWKMEGIDAPGDQPFIEAERSDRWSIKDSRIGGDDHPHRRERKKKHRDEGGGNAASGRSRSVYRYNWIHDNNGPGITARDEIIHVEESVIERNRPDIDAERSTLNIKRTYFGPQNPEPADEPPRPRKGEERPLRQGSQVEA